MLSVDILDEWTWDEDGFLSDGSGKRFAVALGDISASKKLLLKSAAKLCRVLEMSKQLDSQDPNESTGNYQYLEVRYDAALDKAVEIVDRVLQMEIDEIDMQEISREVCGKVKAEAALDTESEGA